MPTTDFFETPSEQSLAKAEIVSSYYASWAQVIKSKWPDSMPIGYLDLFCGPGQYDDGTESVPLRVVRTILADPKLSSRMIIAFNDENASNIENLKRCIAEIDSFGVLKDRIQFSVSTVDNDFYTRIVKNNIPILSFVDPFGYKGLNRTLIQTLIRNNGSDCIFFFNYSRINMALSSNTKFDSYLAGFFGSERTARLKKELETMTPTEREPRVINALIDSLREIQDVSVLPFKFYRTDMHRTSHFIIFVSKHPLACKIMKETMYKVSSKDGDGIALFEFHDQANFGDDHQQMAFFGTPFSALCDELRLGYSGKTESVKQICDKYACSYENRFVARNIKAALIKLEEMGELVVEGRKRNLSNGKKTMPDGAYVKFRREMK